MWLPVSKDCKIEQSNGTHGHSVERIDHTAQDITTEVLEAEGIFSSFL
jgi:hypothetical protein